MYIQLSKKNFNHYNLVLVFYFPVLKEKHSLIEEKMFILNLYPNNMIIISFIDDFFLNTNNKRQFFVLSIIGYNTVTVKETKGSGSLQSSAMFYKLCVLLVTELYSPDRYQLVIIFTKKLINLVFIIFLNLFNILDRPRKIT